MDSTEFRRRGKEMVDYIADYMDSIGDRRSLPDVKPGYLKELIPNHAPAEPEEWDQIMGDIERVIMPGVTHWCSPHFHAYYPSSTSYPALLGDMLSGSLGCIGFSWISSPACTELEAIVMDWLAKAIQLSKQFMSGGKGGGVIQGSASESTLLAILAARSRALRQHNTESHAKLVCYYSEQAHSSVERACLIASVIGRIVASDDNSSMRGPALQQAIATDKANGLIPICCVVTLGTTSECAFDNLLEIGPICTNMNVWVHIDAAYAGSAFICPEFRPLLNGVENADSFNFNPHKWLLVNFDCSAMWFKDSSYVVETFDVDLEILKHEHQGSVPDFRHWQIPLGRRFRSLKIWFVMRSYGISGLQAYIRKHVSLATEFKALVESDSRFEVTHPVLLGLVCFRLKDSNRKNEELLKLVNRDGRIYITASKEKGKHFLRFVVCAKEATSSDIHFAWKAITDITDNLSVHNG